MSGEGMGSIIRGMRNFACPLVSREARACRCARTCRSSRGRSSGVGKPRAAHRRPGARAAGARDRHPVERPFGRRAARLARHRSRGVLRHLAHRDRPDRACAIPARSTAPICRRAWNAHRLASALPRALPDISLTLLVGSYAQAYYLGKSRKNTLGRNGARLPRIPARVLPAAAPELAQPRVAASAIRGSQNRSSRRSQAR